MQMQINIWLQHNSKKRIFQEWLDAFSSIRVEKACIWFHSAWLEKRTLSWGFSFPPFLPLFSLLFTWFSTFWYIPELLSCNSIRTYHFCLTSPGEYISQIQIWEQPNHWVITNNGPPLKEDLIRISVFWWGNQICNFGPKGCHAWQNDLGGR